VSSLSHDVWIPKLPPQYQWTYNPRMVTVQLPPDHCIKNSQNLSLCQALYD
jgi:hypothetical protein